MSRSLPKIREQLTQIEHQTETLGHHFAQTYDQYAQRLGQILQQQGIYAVYQICTQIYPEAFLKLEYSPRQKLQQQLRQAIANFYPQLLNNLEKDGIVLDPSLNPREAEPELTEEDEEALVLLEDEDSGIEEDANVPDLEEIKDFLSQALQKEGLSLEMLLPQGVQTETGKIPSVITIPDNLEHWHLRVEKILNSSLVALSMEINRSLTVAKIIPPNLPPRILEMALQSEDDRLAPNREKMPHIVNLLIEKAQKPEVKKDGKKTANVEKNGEQNNGEPDFPEEAIEESLPRQGKGEISRLTALNFRLTDLEFSDVNLGLIRKQIHTYLKDLQKLQKQHRQLQRQKLSAEAELAWRSSWIKENPKNI